MNFNLFTKIYLLLSLNTGQSSGFALQDYCDAGEDHVICLHECKRGKMCGDKTESGMREMTKQEREAIVHDHNQQRHHVARGTIRARGFEPSTNMHLMSYDKELEFLASCFLRQCDFTEGWSFITTLDVRQVGANYYSKRKKTYDSKFMGTTFYNEAIKAWFEEYKLFTKPDAWRLLNGSGTLENARNFTQLIWASTKYVGCSGIHTMREGKGIHTYDFYCVYEPLGDASGPPYADGTPPCEVQKVHKHFKPMCGKIRPITEDTFVTPSINYNLASDLTMSSSIPILFPLVVMAITFFFNH